MSRSITCIAIVANLISDTTPEKLMTVSGLFWQLKGLKENGCIIEKERIMNKQKIKYKAVLPEPDHSLLSDEVRAKLSHFKGQLLVNVSHDVLNVYASKKSMPRLGCKEMKLSSCSPDKTNNAP